MEKFNSNLKQLLEQIKKLFPEQAETIDSHYVFDDNTKDKYLVSFYDNCKNLGEDVSSKNEIIFSKENIILDEVDFFKIWNSETLTDEYKENIWKYIHTMYILAYESIKQSDIKSLLKQLKSMRASSEEIEHDSEILLNIVDSLTGKYTEKDTDSKDSENEENKNHSQSFNGPDLFNGMIGDLAKEIATEIDTSAIDINNPQQLLNDLLTGNFDEENDASGITNLVKNITDKIQDKITSGSFDEQQLFGEAQNVLNNLGGNNGKKMKSPMGNIFNNMMNSNFMSDLNNLNQENNSSSNQMKDIFNMMNSSMNPNINHYDAEEKELFKNAQNIINNNNKTNIDQQKLQKDFDKKSNRKRLKEKLQKKKKLLIEKENELKKQQQLLENNIVNESEEDLDKLAAEIENIGKKK